MSRHARRYSRPVTVALMGGTGVLLLAVSFFNTNPHPGISAAAGAALVGGWSWLRYRDGRELASVKVIQRRAEPARAKELLGPFHEHAHRAV
uniref:Membrane protein n=1 Tax=Mycobacterium phage BobbyK TaxID=3158892 RepID=A0AAU8GQN7_9CAUD